MATHFEDLNTLRLHHCTLPPAFLPNCAPTLSEKLQSLSLAGVSGTSVDDMAAISQLTALSTLRLMPREHGFGGLGSFLPLRLKQLKLRCVVLRMWRGGEGRGAFLEER